jgi:hypothetical protein
VTSVATQTLASHQERLALVGHILDDSRATPAAQQSGLIVQDLRSATTTLGDATRIDPAKTVTTVTLLLEPSSVFASTDLQNVFTETQLLSAILGMVFGILGSFTAGFAMFETLLGRRIRWLCGDTGIIESESEALEKKKSLSRQALESRSAGKMSGRPTVIMPVDDAGTVMADNPITRPRFAGKRAGDDRVAEAGMTPERARLG